eukprot:2968467-Rhodomonas_salina.1
MAQLTQPLREVIEVEEEAERKLAEAAARREAEEKERRRAAEEARRAEVSLCAALALSSQGQTS